MPMLVHVNKMKVKNIEREDENRGHSGGDERATREENCKARNFLLFIRKIVLLLIVNNMQLHYSVLLVE